MMLRSFWSLGRLLFKEGKGKKNVSDQAFFILTCNSPRGNELK
jgi:hypothetical protein